MKTETIILALAIVSTGILAGIFFTWSNAVTPGIGRLRDVEYLRALQSMNRVILNPAFRILFMGAVVTVVLAPIFQYKADSGHLPWLLLAAFVIYWAGAFGVTILGNIPLNRILDNTDLDTLSTMDVKNLRITIEAKWNFLNWIRTFSSLSTFLLLILALIQHKN